MIEEENIVEIEFNPNHPVGVNLIVNGSSMILGNSMKGSPVLRKNAQIIEGAPIGTPYRDEALKAIQKFL